MDREGRYLQMVEGSGGDGDNPIRQGRRSSSREVAGAGYRTVSLADGADDCCMTELSDPFSDKVL